MTCVGYDVFYREREKKKGGGGGRDRSAIITSLTIFNVNLCFAKSFLFYLTHNGVGLSVCVIAINYSCLFSLVNDDCSLRLNLPYM